MPRRRSRPAPAADGTWERCVESVFCHENDCFPRILCFYPFAISLIFALVFSLSPNIQGVGPTKAILSALGAIGAAAIPAFLLSGLPACRRAGCARGAEEYASDLRAALFPRPAPPPRVAEAPEFAAPEAAGTDYAVANPLPAAASSAEAAGGAGGASEGGGERGCV